MMEMVVLPDPGPCYKQVTLQKYALQGLKVIFRAGYHYKKGVILSDISNASVYQADMFASVPEKPELMQTLDRINQRYGKGTLKLSRDGSRHSWKMRQENKSPEYTTNWNELPVCD
jgi:DNA polymerase V